MKVSNSSIAFSIIILVITLFSSCREVVTDFDCGEVETEITALSHTIGSYTAPNFAQIISTNFEEAAIAVEVAEVEGFPDCFSFTAIPQLIEKVSISSPKNIFIAGVEYAPNADLIELFKVNLDQQSYSIQEFVIAQNDEPLLFHSDNNRLFLQLINKPDVAINQAFVIEIAFDDSKTVSLEIPNFEVSN